MLDEYNWALSVQMQRDKRWLGMGSRSSGYGLRMSARWKFRLGCSDDKAKQKCEHFTAIVRQESMVTDTVQNSMSCSKTFKDDFGVAFINLRIVDIVADITTSKFPTATSRATFVYQIRVGSRISITKMRSLSFWICTERSHVQSLRLSHISFNRVLWFLSRKIFLMSQATVALSKENLKPAYYLAHFFYMHEETLFDECQFCRLE